MLLLLFIDSEPVEAALIKGDSAKEDVWWELSWSWSLSRDVQFTSIGPRQMQTPSQSLSHKLARLECTPSGLAGWSDPDRSLILRPGYHPDANRFGKRIAHCTSVVLKEYLARAHNRPASCHGKRPAKKPAYRTSAHKQKMRKFAVAADGAAVKKASIRRICFQEVLQYAATCRYRESTRGHDIRIQ